jgi:hypothetical protein
MRDRVKKRWDREFGRRRSLPFKYSYGFAIFVVRPKHPNQSLREMHGIESPLAFQGFLSDQFSRGNPYRFVGYLGRNGSTVLNGSGRQIDHLRLGDSLGTGPLFPRPALETA